MQFLTKYYDKLLLILGILFLALCFMFSLSSTDKSANTQIFSSFNFKVLDDSLLLLQNDDSKLLPGEFIFFKDPNEILWSKTKIKSVSFQRNSLVNIILNDGTLKSGTLKQKAVLTEDWNKTPNNFAIRVNRTTELIPFSKVHQISGKQELNLESIPASVIDNPDLELSFYQKATFPDISSDEQPTISKWTRKTNDLNTSSYDLFTPPVIYVHEGRLTTRLPDKELEELPEEPFGISLKSATRKSYPFRLSSWIGNTPYFEDLTSQESSTSDRPVRNRIKTNQFYKKNLDRKPGQPSLIECTPEDPDKLFIIEHFVVQQHKNPQTGGLRPVGRAMVRDLKFDDPFEINSLMKEVFAGEIIFDFEITLPGYSGQSLSFTSSDNGKIFVVGGREYKIIEINLTSKFIKVTKQDPRLANLVEESFVY